MALERLAATRGGRIFDPACLTEDYENGFRLHALGCRQIFVPLRLPADAPVATREYFPRRLRAAIRQRSRWVAGIALQGWEHHGWRAPLRQLYFFWRDRKGLVGNLLSPIANLLFLGWVCGWRGFGGVPAWAARLCTATLSLSADPLPDPHRVERAGLRLAVRRRRAAAHVLGQPAEQRGHHFRFAPVRRRAPARARPGLAQNRP